MKIKDNPKLLKCFNIITNLILILLFILIITYLAINIEHIKYLSEPCKICMEKTGVTCFAAPSYATYYFEPTGSYLKKS